MVVHPYLEDPIPNQEVKIIGIEFKVDYMGVSRPFLKWAGGKHRVVSELWRVIEERPLDLGWEIGKGERYHEPFLGSGAMFFGLKSKGLICTNHYSYLSDLNPALINAMQVVSDEERLDELILLLKSWQVEYGKEGPVRKNTTQDEREAGMYYRMRRRLNDFLAQSGPVDDGRRIEYAALVIFLNKTCFNGLWRMNRGGLFNVPEGDYVRPRNICQEGLLRSCSKLLTRTKIESLDWRMALKRARAGDLVYLDPPYMPLKIGEQVFTSYYTEGFDFGDQIELANAAAKAASKGVRVIASNHDTDGHPNVRRIYSDAARDNGCRTPIFKEIEVSRNISCKGHGRVRVGEILIFMVE